MLKIWVGDFQPGCIKNPSRFFDLHKQKDWFNRDDVRRIIREIDDVEAIQDEYMVSPIFGAIAPERLSSGAKCLILLTINPSLNVYASRMGDNCAGFLLDIAEKTDVVVTLHHVMIFPRDFEGVLLDNGMEIHTRSDWIKAYLSVRPY